MYRLFEEKDERFKTKVILFFSNFGTHLQIGRYVFGCRYNFESLIQANQDTSEQRMASVSKIVKGMGLSATAEGGGLFFKASGGFSVQSTDSKTDSSLNS